MAKLLSAEQVLNEIKSLLKTSDIKVEINRDTRIAQLKIDSLDLLNLVIKIEQKLQIKLDDEHIIKAKTVGDLINLIIGSQRS